MRYKVLFVLLMMMTLALPALAQDGAPPPPELDGDIVLQGLTGPQGLYIDDEGNLWVLDSGLGGDEEVTTMNPETMEPIPAQFGLSGQLIKVTPDGEQEVVALLPSVAIPEDVIGPARMVSLDGTVYATVGAWQVSAGEEVTIPMQAELVRIEDGAPVTVASLWAHELANNPDETGNLESHPYGITAGADGLLYIADAAANAVISVDPATGETATVAVFEGLPGVFPSPFRNNELITDPVPTQ
ncbi:MAG: ScyD/ScyE family protein, partial [Anaerolineae bacterium]|nr:ScyD/ScyE family protein [Anaerolineae bacterium]